MFTDPQLQNPNPRRSSLGRGSRAGMFSLLFPGGPSFGLKNKEIPASNPKEMRKFPAKGQAQLHQTKLIHQKLPKPTQEHEE